MFNCIGKLRWTLGIVLIGVGSLTTNALTEEFSSGPVAGEESASQEIAGGDAKSIRQPVRKAYGLEKRPAWTTSRIQGTPDPPLPYTTAVAFPKLKFFEPLAMTSVPGSNRLVIAERPGKVHTFEGQVDVAEKRLLLDTGQTTYGVALHPDYQDNGYVFVTSERPARFDAAN